MVKNLPATAGDQSSIPGSGRSPGGGGHGNPLQYPCLENPMDRGACGLQSVGSHRVGLKRLSLHDGVPRTGWTVGNSPGRHREGVHAGVLMRPRSPTKEHRWSEVAQGWDVDTGATSSPRESRNPDKGWNSSWRLFLHRGALGIACVSGAKPCTSAHHHSWVSSKRNPRHF